MAISYQPLDLTDQDLFGIAMSGTVGRPDKQKLLDLADACLERGKLRLIMDLSELSAIGGGGAKILAEFQERSGQRRWRSCVRRAPARLSGASCSRNSNPCPCDSFPPSTPRAKHFDDPDYEYDPDEADAESASPVDEATADDTSPSTFGSRGSSWLPGRRRLGPG